MSGGRIIVLGAGHNGLTAAATLARAGAPVTVLEARDRVGGSAATIEVAPGARDSYAFGSLELLHPRLVRDLRLGDHGLSLTAAPAGTTVLGGDAPLRLDGVDPSRGLAADDARGLAALERLLARTAAALEPTFSGSLPEIEPQGLGDVIELLTLGWRLRKLGRRDMPEAMRLLPMSARDIVEEHVEDPRLQAAIAWEAVRAAWLGPWSPGGGLGLLWHRPAWRPGLLTAPIQAVGGSGALTDALAAAAIAAGARIQTGAGARRILAGPAGVTGVELADGSTLEGAAVLSALHPRTTLLELLEPGWLDPDVITAASNVRGRGTVAIVTVVAAALPRFDGVSDEALAGRLQIGGNLVALERAFDAAKYGAFPEAPVLEVSFPTVGDPALAPGKTIAHVWLQYAAHELRDSDWNSERERLGRLVVDAIDAHASGFADTVEHVRVTTPQDIAADLGIAGGHLYHLEPALDQALYMRPMAGWYDSRTPVDGLYLGGPGCHPGGGLTGLPGAIAAGRLLRDWKSKRRERSAS